VEDENTKLKSEYAKIKGYSEQIETQKKKNETELNNMINAYSMHKGRLETVEPKLAEVEAANKRFETMLKDKEAKLNEALKTKEQLKKKYANIKKKLKEHVETESKLAKENDNLIQKLKKIECEQGNELQIVKEAKEQLTAKNTDLENQLKEFISLKQKSAENESALIESKTKMDELQEYVSSIESQKSELQEECKRQSEIASQSQKELSELHKDFEGIKTEIVSNDSQAKAELSATKAKLAEMSKENGNLQKEIQEKKEIEGKLQEKIKQSEDDLKEKNEKMQQNAKLIQELEERSSKLMEALHQDINNKAKQYKANPVQSEKNLLIPTTDDADKDLFSFRENSLKSNKQIVNTPPQNLIVESTDDIEVYETFAKHSPAPNLRSNSKVSASPSKNVKSSEKKESHVLRKISNNELGSAKKNKDGLQNKLNEFEQRLNNSLMQTKIE
jgi:chromosome segregation ATPase